MAMLEGVTDLTLELLQETTQAWVELEYNRTVHSETGQKPIDRFLTAPEVLRPCPASDDLRNAFRQDTTRTQRKSDGTASLEAVRFEVPSRFRHLERLTIRYARWNLRFVHLVDERTGDLLAQLYPQDKVENAEGKRRLLEPSILSEVPSPEPAADGMAPLLRKLLRDYAASGIPPAYLPQTEKKEDEA